RPRRASSRMRGDGAELWGTSSKPMKRSTILEVLTALLLVLGGGSIGQATAGETPSGQEGTGQPLWLAQATQPGLPDLGGHEEQSDAWDVKTMQQAAPDEADSLDVKPPTQKMKQAAPDSTQPQQVLPTEAAPDTLFPVGSKPNSAVPTTPSATPKPANPATY